MVIVNGEPAECTSESGRSESATQRDRWKVGVAGIFSAAVGLLVLLLAARHFSLADNTRFSLFWSVLFFTFGIVAGLAVETTRSTTSANSHPAFKTPTRSVSILTVGAVAMIGILLIIGGTLPAWRLAIPAFTNHDGWLICLAILMGLVGYAGQSVLVGALSGREAWSLYAAVTFAESLVRMGLLILAKILGGGVVQFAFATVLAEYAWIVILIFSPTAKAALNQRTDVPVAQFARRVGGAMLGLGASSILLVGFPWLVGLTTPEPVLLGAAPLLLAISLTRAPLMVPISSLYNVAVAHFTQRQQSSLRLIRLLLLSIASVGIAGGALAWAIGPWLFRLIRPDYDLSGMTLAGLTLGAACIAMITITGILCQSGARYTHYLIGWLVAVGVAIAILIMPFSLTTRTISALIVGPLCGMVLHLILLIRWQVSAKRFVSDGSSDSMPQLPKPTSPAQE